MIENKISTLVLDAAYKIHLKLGRGLLESVYQECLFYELRKMNLDVKKEVQLPVKYEEVDLDSGYRVDLIIEQKFIIEVKSVEKLNDIHLAQILTYLKLSNIRLGLLINFNVSRLKYGIRRVINKQNN